MWPVGNIMYGTYVVTFATSYYIFKEFQSLLMTHIFKMDGGKLRNILTLNSGPWECNSDNNSKTSTTSATRVYYHTYTDNAWHTTNFL